jgi:Rhs element Vgr protein
MAESPIETNSDIVTLTIKADGSTIDSSIGIISVNIFYQVNHIAYAELEIRDGDIATQAFDVSSGNSFKPGSTITINAGYGNDDEPIFEGVVTNHAVRISGNNQTTLNVTCKDQAVAMTIARKSQCYLEQKDSDIINSIISNYSKITVPSIDDTSVQYDELVQFNCSDWDFILTRAEANGMVVVNQQNGLTIQAPSVSDSAALVVTYGTDLINLCAEVDARYQFDKVTSTAWDPSTQQMLSQQSPATSINGQGNLTASELASVLSIDEYRMQTSASYAQESLTNWAKGQRIKSMLSKVRGSVTFQGNAKAQINSLIELAGVGDRFNGSHYIGAVHHSVEQGQWLTTVDLGLAPAWSAEHRDIGAPPAAGWLPPVDGLQIGIVSQLNDDPQSQYRIKVKVPALGENNNELWARLSSYYATSESGNFFIPEIGDEVLLGYINQDPGQPIVLGSLYSSEKAMPYELTAENDTKAIVTKNKLKIEFNDDKKIITITTPGANTITISDDEKLIKLADQNSNTITMDESGITLNSPKDITISAAGNISLKSSGDTSIDATGDASIKGMNVSAEANVALTAKGSATAELSASGNTTIKGAIVMIN